MNGFVSDILAYPLMQTKSKTIYSLALRQARCMSFKMSFTNYNASFGNSESQAGTQVPSSLTITCQPTNRLVKYPCAHLGDALLYVIADPSTPLTIALMLQVRSIIADPCMLARPINSRSSRVFLFSELLVRDGDQTYTDSERPPPTPPLFFSRCGHLYMPHTWWDWKIFSENRGLLTWVQY